MELMSVANLEGSELKRLNEKRLTVGLCPHDTMRKGVEVGIESSRGKVQGGLSRLDHDFKEPDYPTLDSRLVKFSVGIGGVFRGFSGKVLNNDLIG
jgi:hypothetical protein